MKKLILSILLLFFLSQHAYASQKLEYHCVIDYTQYIMNEQAYYIQWKSRETPYDFNELGIRISTNNDPYYPERFFHLDESLIRDYKLMIDGSILTLKSNEKTLITTDLNNIDKHIQISAELTSYSPSYLMASFFFYNTKIMKQKKVLTVYFDDSEIIDKFVARTWAPVKDNYLDCRNKIPKTTFKKYQQHWISLYEAISKQKAKYTE